MMPKYVTYDEDGKIETYGTTMPKNLAKRIWDGERIIQVPEIPRNIETDFRVHGGRLEKNSVE